MSNIQSVSQTTSPTEAAPVAQPANYVIPSTDILENESEFLLIAEMPGVDSDALEIQLESNLLTIEGKAVDAEGNDVVYHREFRVGAAVDPEGLSAQLRRGLLHLTAKKSEARKPRKIAVNVG